MSKKRNLYYRLAKWICDKCDESENIKYVAYFIDTMVFQIYETILILFVCDIFGLFWYAVFGMFGFAIGRVTNLGYHAPNRFLCVMYSLSIFLLVSYVGSLFGLWMAFLLGLVSGFLLRVKK